MASLWRHAEHEIELVAVNLPASRRPWPAIPGDPFLATFNTTPQLDGPAERVNARVVASLSGAG